MTSTKLEGFILYPNEVLIMAFYREAIILALTELEVRLELKQTVYKRLVNLCVYVIKEFLF